MLDQPDITIINNPDARRFEATVDGFTAVVEYILATGKIVFTHTEVPVELEGRGIAGKMARHVLEYARTEGLEVIPLCPFMASYIRRHTEYIPLVQKGYRA